MQMPEYTSGAMQYYRIRQDDQTDYPEEYLEDPGVEISGTGNCRCTIGRNTSLIRVEKK